MLVCSVQMDQQEQIVGEMDKLLTREELKNLLTDVGGLVLLTVVLHKASFPTDSQVISGLDRFRWQDLARDLLPCNQPSYFFHGNG